MIAKSLSILAQMPWSTRFQVTSVVVSSVTTATSRMTEATHTLFQVRLGRCCSRKEENNGNEWNTYNPPRRNIDMIVILRSLEIWSFNTYGMGKTRRARSMAIFGMEIAKRNLLASTSQDASMLLSQKPRVGMHCNSVRRNCMR